MDYRNLIMITTLGLSIITQSLREASTICTKSSAQAVKAFAFVNGSGLDITIQRFGLNLNAGELRYEFYQIFKIRR
jgi:hypothetical protein